MPRVYVSMRAEADVDDAVTQQQARALILMEWIKGDYASRRSVACARHTRVDNHRSAELLNAGSDIESVQPMEVAVDASRCFFSFGDYVEGAGARVDYG